LSLSGGQRQRLILARALARRPLFLVMDEATNAVDRSMERAIHKAVRDIGERMTVIFVTHRWELALDADRVLVMRDGEIEAYGRPDEIFERIRALSMMG
jgi:ATP-binding cassette subfamily B protein